MAINPLDFLNAPSNPVQALADCWGIIAQLDDELVRLREAEEEAHAEKDRLECLVLAQAPASIDDCLAMVLVVHAELPKEGSEHLGQALAMVAQWLADNGAAECPMLHTYLPAATAKQPSDA